MNDLDRNIGRLGFGLMRLPMKDGRIDVEQTSRMVDMFMEAGFNYFDTAWAYDGSEEAIRKALVERYPRESFYIASKNAGWIKNRNGEEARRILDESLERAGLEYFDYYLIHNAGQWRTEYFDKYDLWNWAIEQKKAGKIKHLGFSAHASAEELEHLLCEHPEMEFVQLQLNYGDWEDGTVQARKCYEAARKYNKPIIVMEPVKGGMLATPPESVQQIFRKAAPDASYASWAIKFAADLEGVMTVLSGMSSVEQMADNLSFMKDFKGLTEDEKKTIEQAREKFAEVPLIPCTACNYCAKVCPENIAICKTLYALNYLTLYGNFDLAKHEQWIGVHIDGKKSATECIDCGRCEEACTQHIKIRDELRKAVETFA